MAQTTYCVRCKRKVIPDKVARARVGKRPALRGTCPQCGGRVCRFL